MSATNHAQLALFERQRAVAKAKGSANRSCARKRGRPPAQMPARERYLPHVARDEHDEAHPVHVTMRRVPSGPSFRAQRVCAAIRMVIAGAKRNGVRVLHYSVQDNHLHLMVEGSSSADLSSQMRALFSRIAFAVNAVAHRHGKLFRDRHHRHALKKPREVRNALVYILFNDRKHRAARARSASASASAAGAVSASALALSAPAVSASVPALSTPAVSASAPALSTPPALDPCSSAWWFHDWSPSDHPPREQLLSAADAPTSRPRTWLARWGWHRGDKEKLLRFSEHPCAARVA